MALKYDLFLKRKYEDYQLNEEVRTLEIYDFVADRRLAYLFAVMQQKFNNLIGFMYKKKETNGHYNAEQSREFIEYIKLYRDTKYMMKDTGNDFIIDEDYEEILNQCQNFLVSSGGSPIPEDLKNIELKEYEPIFGFATQIEVKNSKNKVLYPIKLIGNGSYAQVFKYYDEFYNKNFIIKRADKDLNKKEITRFKKEYEVMKELKSPYVLDVYRYDEKNNEYYAEYADETIYDYILSTNNKLTLVERKGIVYQIFKAFKYIHSRGYLHRDISYTNVLVIKYDDVIVIKVSDFGLVKDKESNLTSIESEIKGSLNDIVNLDIIGFDKYSMIFETYALSKLIMFVLTGKTNYSKVKEQNIKEFVSKGIDPNLNNRYKSIDEMKEYFNKLI